MVVAAGVAVTEATFAELRVAAGAQVYELAPEAVSVAEPAGQTVAFGDRVIEGFAFTCTCTDAVPMQPAALVPLTV